MCQKDMGGTMHQNFFFTKILTTNNLISSHLETLQIRVSPGQPIDYQLIRFGAR